VSNSLATGNSVHAATLNFFFPETNNGNHEGIGIGKASS
jgi:hypothetical protein